MVSKATIDTMRRQFVSATRDERDEMLLSVMAVIAESMDQLEDVLRPHADLLGSAPLVHMGRVFEMVLTLQAWAGVPAEEFPGNVDIRPSDEA